MTSNPVPSANLLQAVYWQNLDRANMNEAEREKAKANIAAIGAIQDAFDASASAIHQNGDLSAQGRASALLANSTRSLAQLDALAKPNLAALDAQLVSASRALRKAAAGPADTAVTELKAIEARAAFERIDPLLRPGVYLELCGNGESDADCIAVENASAFTPLLDAETIQKGIALRGARQLPDAARELEVAQDLRAMLGAIVASARRHMTLAPTLDPLQVAPLGPTADDPDLE